MFYNDRKKMFNPRATLIRIKSFRMIGVLLYAESVVA